MQLQQGRLQSTSSRLASSRFASASFSSVPIHRGVRRGGPVRIAAAQWVDIHAGFKLLERASYLVVDVRSFKEYDREHIVKPAKTCFSVPYQPGTSSGAITSELQKKIGPGVARGLLIMSAEGGESAASVADMLEASGYETVRAVEGGYGARSRAWRSLSANVCCGHRRSLSLESSARLSGASPPHCSPPQRGGGNSTRPAGARRPRRDAGWRRGRRR